MAGKSGTFTVLILVIAFAVAGCSSPAGGIGPQDVPSASVYEGLVVEYKRPSYYIGESFKRDDLTAISVKSDGTRQLLQTGTYQIVVIEDLNKPQEESPVPSTRYEFKSTGAKAIRVKYNNVLSVQYRITVLAPGNNGGQASGITLKWPDP